jgi:hypothetical protein
VRNQELICDILEALEEIKALGEWKKVFLAVYKFELKRTGLKVEAKANALKVVKWSKECA